MPHSNQNFITTINCMDGRVQLPVINYLRKKYQAEYVDMITEAGPVKILADGIEKDIIRDIKKRLIISSRRHGSKRLAIVAHYDCAGNPVSKEQQVVDLNNSIQLIKKWKLFPEIIGLWVDQNWKVGPSN